MPQRVPHKIEFLRLEAKRASFFEQHTALYPSRMLAVGLFLLLLPGAVVAWLVFFVCWWGRPVPTPASCAKCGHPSGDHPGFIATTCTECGADFTNERAVRYFERERTTLMKIGLVASATAIAGTTFLPLGSLAILYFAFSQRTTAVAPPPAPTPPPPATTDETKPAGGTQ